MVEKLGFLYRIWKTILNKKKDGMLGLGEATVKTSTKMWQGDTDAKLTLELIHHRIKNTSVSYFAAFNGIVPLFSAGLGENDAIGRKLVL